MRRFVADRGDHARRLDHVLVRHLADLPELSRSIVLRWIEEGRIRVKGEVELRKARRLRHRDAIEVEVPESWGDRPPIGAEEIALEVIWEDEHYLAVAKPAGLVVHPTWGYKSGTLINALLWRAREWTGERRPRLVHRLDRETSGLILVAKSARAASAAGRAFAAGKSRKDYLAVARGLPAVRKGQLTGRLVVDPDHPSRRRVSRDEGRESVTDFELLAENRSGELSLLRCRLQTGRTHQIRAHLEDAGLPLVGDPIYRGEELPLPRDPEIAAACAAFPRQALHAWHLGLDHPLTGEPLELEAPVPADLRELLTATGFEATI